MVTSRKKNVVSYYLKYKLILIKSATYNMIRQHRPKGRPLSTSTPTSKGKRHTLPGEPRKFVHFYYNRMKWQCKNFLGSPGNHFRLRRVKPRSRWKKSTNVTKLFPKVPFWRQILIANSLSVPVHSALF